MCWAMPIRPAEKALGGQYGCLYIDEINIVDMDFVREAPCAATICWAR